MAHPAFDKYLGEKRLLLVFSKDENADTFKWQKKELENFQIDLEARDVETIYLFGNGQCEGADFSAETVAALFDEFEVKNGQFTAILLGKDADEKLRDDRPLAAQALLSIIDVMPTRKQEKGR